MWNFGTIYVIAMIAFIAWIAKISDEPKDPRPIHRAVKATSLLVACIAVNAYFFGWFMNLIRQYPFEAALFVVTAVVGFTFHGPQQSE